MDFPSTLRVAAPSNIKVFEVKENQDGTIELFGFEANLLKVLAQFLHFKIDLISYKESFGREMPDGNWTGVVGMLKRDEIDLAVGVLAVTDDRLKVIDFGYPYIWDDAVFLKRHPGSSPSISSILLPYDVTVWTCILVLTLVMPLIFIVLLKLKSSYVQLLLDMFANLLLQGSKTRCDSTPGRILSGFWSLSASILAFGYCVVLLSFLAVPPEVKGIRNFKELSDAVAAGTHRCFTVKNSAYIYILLTSEKEHLRNLGQAIIKNEWYMDNTFFKARNIRKHDSIILVSSGATLQFGNPLETNVKGKYLDHDSYVLVKSEDHIASWLLSMGVQKGFCCKAKLDTMILRILSSGIYWNWIEFENYKSHVISMWKSDPWRDGVPNISLAKSAGSFKILFSGHLIAFIVLLIENFTFYFKRGSLKV